jgi:predicted transcriptional regulator
MTDHATFNAQFEELTLNQRQVKNFDQYLYEHLKSSFPEKADQEWQRLTETLKKAETSQFRFAQIINRMLGHSKPCFTACE